jgi:hypothetical protein
MHHRCAPATTTPVREGAPWLGSTEQEADQTPPSYGALRTSDKRVGPDDGGLVRGPRAVTAAGAVIAYLGELLP